MGMQTHDVTDANVMADINVTPMVDVMLVLLIIFMVVTPTIVAGVQAQLPQGQNLKARQIANEDERTTLGIDVAGNYYLNKKPIRKEDALNLLIQEFQRHPQDKVIFVRADRNLRYQEILDAMVIARDAGARVFAAVSESKPGVKANDEIVNE
jgi:biopolymer transport protein TolR